MEFQGLLLNLPSPKTSSTDCCVRLSVGYHGCGRATWHKPTALVSFNNSADSEDRQRSGLPGVVASVATADRKAFIELVATRRSPIDAELSTAANVHEPEVLARRVFDRVEKERQREQAQSSVFPMWPFGTGQ